MRRILGFFTILVIYVLFVPNLKGQTSFCDSVTPQVIVDLTSDPNGVFISNNIGRTGNCCGGTSKNTPCVEFVVTLNPDAEGIVLDILSGPVAASMKYQRNCGPSQDVGEPICLSGIGPHFVSFCKPGGNLNVYQLTSVAEPIIPDSIYVNDGCTKEIGIVGFEDTTIRWNTVSPGAYGAYNHYLSCTTGCDTTYVTPQVGYPPFIEVEVCGKAFGGCDTTRICDTMKINIFSTLAVDISPEFPTVCFGSPGTFIKANPSGGSPPYNYTWSTLETTDSIFVNTGTYWVEVGDTSGCPPTYDTVVVTSFSLPIEAIAGNDSFSCVEAIPVSLNGQVISASGGTWVGAGTFSPSADSLSTLYTPDSIEIVNGLALIKLITTGNGSCPADTDIVQIELLKFDANVQLDSIPVSCKGNADGTAIVMASGSRAPFAYQWDAQTGNQVGDSATNLTAGSYSVTITDSAGCILDSATTVIESDSVLTLGITTSPVTCFDSADGSATLSITGGTPPYVVTWDPLITVINGNTVSNLVADTFLVSILDEYGCQIDTFFVIDGPLAPLSSVMSKIDVSCKKGNDGAATVTVSGGTSPYTYLWSDSAGFQTTQSAINLTVGLYSVLVKDTMGCILMDSINITEPPSPITFTDTFTPPSCYGFLDGTASVFPTGGTPPYTFLWDSAAGNQTGQTATGLGAGTYSVIIYDLNSCLRATPIVVEDPMPLFATAVEIINVTCKGGANGSAKVTPTGGTPPYTFQWDSLAGGQTDSIATNLSAGIYAIFVYDQNGCSYIPGIEILEPDDSLIVNTNSVPVSCKGGNNGMAIGFPYGGTPPYTIQWNAAANNQVTDTAINLAAGSYVISVTDSNNCMADSTVIVGEPANALAVGTFSSSTLCFGDSNGLAAVSATGGIPPYTINWDSQAGNQTTDTAVNLSTGTYLVNITDDNNCVIDTNVFVGQPDDLVLSGAQRNVFCKGDFSAWAFISVTGGIGPYDFQWDSASGYQTGDSALNLPASIHTVVASDSNGCSIDSSFVITEPPIILSMLSFAEDVSCFGDSTGKAFVSVSGGSPPYNYAWGTNANSQTTDTAFNLKPGSYHITVSDSLNCAVTDIINIFQPNAPLTVNVSGQQVSCFDGSDGIAVSNASGGTMPYFSQWTSSSGVQTGDTALNLKAGWVSLVLTDTNSCSATDSVEITQPTEVLLTLSNSDTICIGTSTQIFASANGGNGSPYTYKLLPVFNVSIPHTVAPTSTTTYGFRAIDSLGCESQTEIVTIFVKDLLNDSLDVTSSGNICLGDTVAITGHYSGIYPDFEYDWNTGQLSLQFQDQPTSGQFYTLTISDECALTIKDSVFVDVYPLPQLALEDEIAAGCAPLTVNFSNQVQDPSITSYLWSFGDGTVAIDESPSHEFINPGTYTIGLKVENSFGCKSENGTSNYVEVFSIPNASFTSNPPITDQQTPIIQFMSTSSPDPMNLIHLWTFDDGGQSDEQNPRHYFADTGSYFVQLEVIDDNGCRDSTIESVIVQPYFVLNIPNAFTPNPGGSSGGKYDPQATNNWVFFPQTEGVEEYLFRIYNRWGELIFESKDHSIGWDGYYRGKLSSQEVYVWNLKITWENGQDYEGFGDVTLFR